uniref:PAS domain-containing protein n=1 Tax=Tanacetum cinerariifolium TaxID=118510 RepID=A0A699GKC1_TANCI|nr:hypothetical protein [Tanacetum cinerariifolium]
MKCSCAASRASSGATSGIGDLGPAVRGFVQHQLVQAQPGTEAVDERRLEDAERHVRQVFHGGNAVDDHRLVVGQAGQELAHGRILLVHDECVVPHVDQVFLGQRLDVRKVHDHAVVGIAFGGDDLARQRDFQRVTVAVQVAALAFMVGNAVAGVELQLAGNGFDRQGGVERGQRAVHRLHKKMFEVELFVRCQVLVGLRDHDLDLAPPGHHQRGAHLGADADPVHAVWHGQRAVGFDGDRETVRVHGGNQRRIELQQRFAAREHDVFAGGVRRRPQRVDGGGQLLGGLELAAAFAVGAHEIGVAELADGRGAVALASGPQVTARKPAEHGGAPGMGALALQRVKNLFDATDHGDKTDEPCGTFHRDRHRCGRRLPAGRTGVIPAGTAAAPAQPAGAPASPAGARAGRARTGRTGIGRHPAPGVPPERQPAIAARRRAAPHRARPARRPGPASAHAGHGAARAGRQPPGPGGKCGPDRPPCPAHAARHARRGARSATGTAGKRLAGCRQPPAGAVLAPVRHPVPARGPARSVQSPRRRHGQDRLPHPARVAEQYRPPCPGVRGVGRHRARRRPAQPDGAGQRRGPAARRHPPRRQLRPARHCRARLGSRRPLRRGQRGRRRHGADHVVPAARRTAASPLAHAAGARPVFAAQIKADMNSTHKVAHLTEFTQAHQQHSFALNMMQSLVIPTFVIDISGKVIIWNAACERLTGVQAWEMLGTPDHWKAFYDDQRPTLADLPVLAKLVRNAARGPAPLPGGRRQPHPRQPRQAGGRGGNLARRDRRKAGPGSAGAAGHARRFDGTGQPPLLRRHLAGRMAARAAPAAAAVAADGGRGQLQTIQRRVRPPGRRRVPAAHRQGGRQRNAHQRPGGPLRRRGICRDPAEPVAQGRGHRGRTDPLPRRTAAPAQPGQPAARGDGQHRRRHGAGLARHRSQPAGGHCRLGPVPRQAHGPQPHQPAQSRTGTGRRRLGERIGHRLHGRRRQLRRQVRARFQLRHHIAQQLEQGARVGQAGLVGRQVDVAAEGDAVHAVFNAQAADGEDIGLVGVGNEFLQGLVIDADPAFQLGHGHGFIGRAGPVLHKIRAARALARAVHHFVQVRGHQHLADFLQVAADKSGAGHDVQVAFLPGQRAHGALDAGPQVAVDLAILRHHIGQGKTLALGAAVGHVAIGRHVAAVVAAARIVGQFGARAGRQARLGMEGIFARQVPGGRDIFPGQLGGGRAHLAVADFGGLPVDIMERAVAGGSQAGGQQAGDNEGGGCRTLDQIHTVQPAACRPRLRRRLGAPYRVAAPVTGAGTALLFLRFTGLGPLLVDDAGGHFFLAAGVTAFLLEFLLQFLELACRTPATRARPALPHYMDRCWPIRGGYAILRGAPPPEKRNGRFHQTTAQPEVPHDHRGHPAGAGRHHVRHVGGAGAGRAGHEGHHRRPAICAADVVRRPGGCQSHRQKSLACQPGGNHARQRRRQRGRPDGFCQPASRGARRIPQPDRVQPARRPAAYPGRRRCHARHQRAAARPRLGKHVHDGARGVAKIGQDGLHLHHDDQRRAGAAPGPQKAAGKRQPAPRPQLGHIEGAGRFRRVDRGDRRRRHPLHLRLQAPAEHGLDHRHPVPGGGSVRAHDSDPPPGHAGGRRTGRDCRPAGMAGDPHHVAAAEPAAPAHRRHPQGQRRHRRAATGPARRNRRTEQRFPRPDGRARNGAGRHPRQRSAHQQHPRTGPGRRGQLRRRRRHHQLERGRGAHFRLAPQRSRGPQYCRTDHGAGAGRATARQRRRRAGRPGRAGSAGFAGVAGVAGRRARAHCRPPPRRPRGTDRAVAGVGAPRRRKLRHRVPARRHRARAVRTADRRQRPPPAHGGRQPARADRLPGPGMPLPVRQRHVRALVRRRSRLADRPPAGGRHRRPAPPGGAAVPGASLPGPGGHLRTQGHGAERRAHAGNHVRARAGRGRQRGGHLRPHPRHHAPQGHRGAAHAAGPHRSAHGHRQPPDVRGNPATGRGPRRRRRGAARIRRPPGRQRARGRHRGAHCRRRIRDRVRAGGASGRSSAAGSQDRRGDPRAVHGGGRAQAGHHQHRRGPAPRRRRLAGRPGGPRRRRPVPGQAARARRFCDCRLRRGRPRDDRQRAYRGGGRGHHLPDDGVHHLRQPGHPRRRRHAQGRRVCRHLPGRRHRQPDHGPVRQLSDRHGAGHGPERIFCVCRGAGHGRAVAIGAGRRVHFRLPVFPGQHLQGARAHRQRHPPFAAGRHYGRAGPVPGVDRHEKRRPGRQQPRHAGHRGRHAQPAYRHGGIRLFADRHARPPARARLHVAAAVDGAHAVPPRPARCAVDGPVQRGAGVLPGGTVRRHRHPDGRCQPRRFARQRQDGTPEQGLDGRQRRHPGRLHAGHVQHHRVPGKRRRRAGRRPHGPDGRRGGPAVPGGAVLCADCGRGARLRHRARPAVRGMPDAARPGGSGLDRNHRKRAGRHYRAGDPVYVFHRPRHRLRFHYLCGIETADGPGASGQAGGVDHCGGVPRQVQLRQLTSTAALGADRRKTRPFHGRVALFQKIARHATMDRGPTGASRSRPPSAVLHGSALHRGTDPGLRTSVLDGDGGIAVFRPPTRPGLAVGHAGHSVQPGPVDPRAVAGAADRQRRAGGVDHGRRRLADRCPGPFSRPPRPPRFPFRPGRAAGQPVHRGLPECLFPQPAGPQLPGPAGAHHAGLQGQRHRPEQSAQVHARCAPGATGRRRRPAALPDDRHRRFQGHQRYAGPRCGRPRAAADRCRDRATVLRPPVRTPGRRGIRRGVCGRRRRCRPLRHAPAARRARGMPAAAHGQHRDRRTGQAQRPVGQLPRGRPGAVRRQAGRQESLRAGRRAGRCRPPVFPDHGRPAGHARRHRCRHCPPGRSRPGRAGGGRRRRHHQCRGAPGACPWLRVWRTAAGHLQLFRPHPWHPRRPGGRGAGAAGRARAPGAGRHGQRPHVPGQRQYRPVPEAAGRTRTGQETVRPQPAGSRAVGAENRAQPASAVAAGAADRRQAAAPAHRDFFCGQQPPADGADRHRPAGRRAGRRPAGRRGAAHARQAGDVVVAAARRAGTHGTARSGGRARHLHVPSHGGQDALAVAAAPGQGRHRRRSDPDGQSAGVPRDGRAIAAAQTRTRIRRGAIAREGDGAAGPGVAVHRQHGAHPQRPLAHAIESPVAGAPAGPDDGVVHALAIVAHGQPQMLDGIAELHRHGSTARVARGIGQRLLADGQRLGAHGGPQAARRAGHRQRAGKAALHGQRAAELAQRLAQLDLVGVAHAQVEHLLAAFVDHVLRRVERGVDLPVGRRIVGQFMLDQVHPQDQRLHALQKSIVQRAGDAVALQRALAMALGNTRRHLRQARQVQQVQQHQHCRAAGKLEPHGLRDRWRNMERQRCRRPAPHAVLVGRQHFEPVIARAQVGVIRLAHAARLAPCAVEAFQPVAELHPFRNRQRGSRKIDLQIVGLLGQAQAGAGRKRAPARLQTRHQRRGRHRVAHDPPRIDPAHATRRGVPQPAVRRLGQAGQGPHVGGRAFVAVEVIEALHLDGATGRRGRQCRGPDPDQAIGSLQPELAGGSFHQPGHAVQRQTVGRLDAGKALPLQPRHARAAAYPQPVAQAAKAQHIAHLHAVAPVEAADRVAVQHGNAAAGIAEPDASACIGVQRHGRTVRQRGMAAAGRPHAVGQGADAASRHRHPQPAAGADRQRLQPPAAQERRQGPPARPFTLLVPHFIAVAEPYAAVGRAGRGGNAVQADGAAPAGTVERDRGVVIIVGVDRVADPDFAVACGHHAQAAEHAARQTDGIEPRRPDKVDPLLGGVPAVAFPVDQGGVDHRPAEPVGRSKRAQRPQIGAELLHSPFGIEPQPVVCVELDCERNGRARRQRQRGDGIGGRVVHRNQVLDGGQQHLAIAAQDAAFDVGLPQDQPEALGAGDGAVQANAGVHQQSPARRAAEPDRGVAGLIDVEHGTLRQAIREAVMAHLAMLEYADPAETVSDPQRLADGLHQAGIGGGQLVAIDVEGALEAGAIELHQAAGGREPQHAAVILGDGESGGGSAVLLGPGLVVQTAAGRWPDRLDARARWYRGNLPWYIEIMARTPVERRRKSHVAASGRRRRPLPMPERTMLNLCFIGRGPVSGSARDHRPALPAQFVAHQQRGARRLQGGGIGAGRLADQRPWQVGPAAARQVGHGRGRQHVVDAGVVGSADRAAVADVVVDGAAVLRTRFVGERDLALGVDAAVHLRLGAGRRPQAGTHHAQQQRGGAALDRNGGRHGVLLCVT